MIVVYDQVIEENELNIYYVQVIGVIEMSKVKSLSSRCF